MRVLELLAIGFALVLPRLSAIGRCPGLGNAQLLRSLSEAAQLRDANEYP